MTQTSLEQKITALTDRMNKLQNQNKTLVLQVKELKSEVDLLKSIKNPNSSKNNHMNSTHSVNDKPPRNSQKVVTHNPHIYKADEKKKEMIKPTRTILTPHNSVHNTSINNPSKNQQPKSNKTSIPRIQQKIAGSTPTNKNLARKSISNSASTGNLQRGLGQSKKSFQFSFMPSIKQQIQKVISIQKLDPSYQNSPSKNERHITELIIEEDQSQNMGRWTFENSLNFDGREVVTPKSNFQAKKGKVGRLGKP